MLRFVSYTIGFLLFTELLGNVSSLECYQCTGTIGTQNDCELNLANVNQQNCTPGFVCTLYSITKSNVTEIHRLCSESNECEVIQAKNPHVMDPNITINECRSCNKSYCNSADSYVFNSSMLSVVLSLMSALFVHVAYNKLVE